MKTTVTVVGLFLLLLTISCRNSQIDKQFNQIQNQKKQLAALQKDNEQLKVSIENSINISNIEKVAKEELADKVADKKKLGFPVPIREWLKEDDVYQEVKNMFLESEYFFKPKKIIKLLDDHKAGKRDNSRKIWTIYTFLVWYQEYFIKR